MKKSEQHEEASKLNRPNFEDTNIRIQSSTSNFDGHKAPSLQSWHKQVWKEAMLFQLKTYPQQLENLFS